MGIRQEGDTRGPGYKRLGTISKHIYFLESSFDMRHYQTFAKERLTEENERTGVERIHGRCASGER